jgi:hypothetical protein
MTPNVRRASATADDLPYRYREDAIDFSITEYQVDGGDAAQPQTDDDTLDLFPYQPWENALLSVSISVDENDLNHLFEGDSPYYAKLIVVIDSAATQLRYEEVVEGAQLSAGTYSTNIDLNCCLFREEVTLTPRIVTTEDAAGGLPYAPKEGMRVAGGNTWKVHVDEPEESGTGFPFRYRDFSDGDYPEDAVHLLKRNPEDPAVLVNSCNDPIVDVLETEGFYGWTPYFKNVLKAEFGTSTWIQLVIHTATTIAETDEPQYPWQKGVIEEIGEYLYDDSTYETVVDELGDAVSDPSELRTFIRDLNVAVQLYLDQASQFNKFIDEYQP